MPKKSNAIIGVVTTGFECLPPSCVLGNRGGSGSRLPARQRKNKIRPENVQYNSIITQYEPFIGCLAGYYLAGDLRLALTGITRRPALHDSIGYPLMSASGESSTTMDRLLHASGSHPIPTPGDPKTNQYNQDLGLIHSTNGNHLESPNEGSSIDHQPALEGLTRSARTDSPQKTDRSKSDQLTAAAAGEAGGGGGFLGGLQSGPRPEPRLLRQAALEGLTRSARTDSPQKTDRSKSDQVNGGGGGGGRRRRRLLGEEGAGALRSSRHGPFNPYIPIRSTTIGKSRVAIDPIAMHTSWRSNSDIASVTSIGYPRMSASGESSTTKHRLLQASGSHPIPPPNDPKSRTDDFHRMTCCAWYRGSLVVIAS
ncbi:hypothetical protein F511_27838 [Dorcoceras hygrometricum]|uniref:Uncharacterized protein n=1 Tax=Dorcoceras hygrometricum TaxID=472368 RepID=A0A2Z7BXI3_9LAMI|nr:hypothetical protein F511_27838 [Dorcoceras hygrometricum]